MNCIQMFALTMVNIFLLSPQFASANPVGDISTRSAESVDGDASSSGSPSLDCDTKRPYCCNPPPYSPSLISDLYDELSTAIDVLSISCTNSTFKANVSTQL